MNELYFKGEHLGVNTLAGYGSFVLSSPHTRLPVFHFLTMRCETTLCFYTINLETGVYFKAGASEKYCAEQKSLEGFLCAMASFLKEVADIPSGEQALSSILESGGQDIFWNQFNKLRFLCRGDKSYAPQDTITKVSEYAAQLPDATLESFSYLKPKD